MHSNLLLFDFLTLVSSVDIMFAPQYESAFCGLAALCVVTALHRFERSVQRRLFLIGKRKKLLCNSVMLGLLLVAWLKTMSKLGPDKIMKTKLSTGPWFNLRADL